MVNQPFVSINDSNPFDYARTFLADSILTARGLVKTNADLIGSMFDEQVRPALELRIAGLCLLQGHQDDWGPLPFAFSVVDHLIMGWNCILLSHSRVACTITRMIAEAAIFEIAAHHCAASFFPMWRSNKATGGRVLRLLKGHVDALLHTQLEAVWAGTVAFGHASEKPAAWAIFSAQHTGQSVDVITFGGLYRGPLTPRLAVTLGAHYAILAETTAATFASACRAKLEDANWRAQHAAYFAPVEERWRTSISDLQRSRANRRGSG
jgi:hypothetical protein